jgi:predicted aldo/keto reductase-like oxidoreductase
MVSRVAFGGIPIMRAPKDEAVKLVRETISLGINFIDTAHGYADSEEKIGEGIKGAAREDLVIASKSPADGKKTFDEHLDLSLKRLNVDYIDIYQFHNIASKAKLDAIMSPGGAMEGMDEAVKAGKVRFPAFSSHSIPLAMEIMKSGLFDVVQIPFNYIDNDAEREIIPLARELDMGFIAMKPMGGGMLDNAGLSFRYLMQFGGIVPDPGIETIEEIREIAEIVNEARVLSAEDMAEIERIRKEFGPTWCHRCDYCQPCPQGIPISTALTARSGMKRFTPERARAMSGSAIAKAGTCAACGECTTRCPYHLDIPELLKAAVEHWNRAAGAASCSV